MLDDLLSSRLLWFVIGGLMVLAWQRYKTPQIQKTVMLKSLNRARSQWRTSFRRDIAEFCALASQHYYAVHQLEPEKIKARFSDDIHRLNQLRVRIRLQLDPASLIDSEQTKLTRSMSRAILQLESQQYEHFIRELLRVERCAQRILHKEWRQTHREAALGQLEQES
jgi:hypothetical protein